jgi:hypothetical protein
MRINSKAAKQRIQDIVKHLKDNYDYIGRYDALKFVKKTYSTTPIKVILTAYNLAYSTD